MATVSLEELRRRSADTKGPVSDPCQGGETGQCDPSPEKKTTLLLTDGTPSERRVYRNLLMPSQQSRVLPRLPSHSVGATVPVSFGPTRDILGNSLVIQVDLDGRASYVPAFLVGKAVNRKLRSDGHLGAVAGDC